MLLLFSLIIFFVSITWLWATETDSGPLCEWSHDNYEHRPILWLVTTMITAMIATCGFLALVVFGIAEAASR